MCEQRVVGISDRNVSAAPCEIATYALGSCVGVALYDGSALIGGLAHIMLPDSSMAAGANFGAARGTGAGLGSVDRMKFADTGVEDMVAEMSSLGANVQRMRAKLAGGANMFGFEEDSSIGGIGARNVRGVKRALGRLGIPIVAEDVGADFGRTLFFDLSTGKVRIESFGKYVKEL
jgi:chemotaxis protein CheD